MEDYLQWETEAEYFGEISGKSSVTLLSSACYSFIWHIFLLFQNQNTARQILNVDP